MTQVPQREYPSYTIAIRTLGKAGDKFLAQLDSIHRLVPAPASINVYIPYGYQEPDVPYDDVKFFRCDKGMVAQRALPFKEIETEYDMFENLKHGHRGNVNLSAELKALCSERGVGQRAARDYDKGVALA